MTPMQKIVADELRPEGGRDPEGVRLARAARSTGCTRCSTTTSRRAVRGLAGRVVHAGRLRRGAGALLRQRRAPLGRRTTARRSPRYHAALTGRPSVARVIDEARPYREVFPLPWPDHVG